MEGILPSPDKLLLDNSMQQDEKMGLQMDLKKDERTPCCQTNMKPMLDKRAEDVKHIKKRETEGLRRKDMCWREMLQGS